MSAMFPTSQSRRSVWSCCEPPLLRRRQLLQGAVGGMALAGLSSVGCSTMGHIPNAIGRDAQNFIVHDATNWETRPANFVDAPITPHGTLYVCNHHPFPDRRFVSERQRWRLEVLGTMDSGSLSLADLQALGTESVIMVLQCAGNGRSFFDHRPDGPNWGIGAVGCVMWTGVPIKRVAAALGGVKARARYATGTGGEPLNPALDELFSMRVERSIPITKALDDCLLAWSMNGAPISLVHGGPLRLIVPGYFGVNQVKYLKQLAFTEDQSDADVMQHEYRCRPVGVEGAATQPTTWAMDAKSIIWPIATAVRRSTHLHGVAFAGGEPIERVEVTWNDGRDWRPAIVSGPNMGRYAWRRFEIPVDVPRGRRKVASRAIDAAGNRQAEWRTSNAGGYANSSWRDHAVSIDVV